MSDVFLICTKSSTMIGLTDVDIRQRSSTLFLWQFINISLHRIHSSGRPNR